MRHWGRTLGRWIYQLDGERDRCPACESDGVFDLDLHLLRKPIGGRRIGFFSGCDRCGLVFRNPPPTTDELKQFYSPEGEWGAPRAHESIESAAPKARGNVNRSWARLFEQSAGTLDVTKPPAGARVLDFGCGDGRLLDLLQDCGWETSGIETAVDTAFRRHRRLDEIPGEPTFDLVIAHHVLEHVVNPLDILRRLAAAGRQGAHLLVSVPRLDTLPIHRDYKYVLNGAAHVTAYTWPCMRSLLARAAWVPVATPPERVGKGGGRTTAARLRVMARRQDDATDPGASPGVAAREAIRGYYRVLRRPVLERLGLLRLAARRAEARRQRQVRAKKAEKREVELRALE